MHTDFLKKTKKNALLLLLASAMALSGCSVNGQTSADTSLADSEVSSQTITEKSESGEYPNFDEINIIEINGQQVSLPFRIEELGKDYSMGEVQGNDQKYPCIEYNGQCLAVVEQDSKSNIVSMAITSDALEQNDIKVYNLTKDNSFEEIIKSLGTPTNQKELALTYEYNSGTLYFGSENGSLGFNYVEISLTESASEETAISEDNSAVEETLDNAETVTIAGKEFPIDSENIEILLTNDSKPITDISEIKNLKNLTSLTIRNISDGGNRAVDGLAELAGLETITNISIMASLADTSDINVLETLPNLKSLTLFGINNYEDFGFDLPSLEYLYIAETFDLSRIKHLTNLKELGLEYNFSDDLSPVADLTNLKSLSITECGFSDYSCILKLNDPDKLFISSKPMSENMYDQIAEKFPDCEITIVNDFVD